MKIIVNIVVLLFTVTHIYGQNAKFKKLELQESLFEYFELPREQIYLHLNKSVYVHGEELWFKGYIYDFSKKNASTTTENIEIGLYDAKGKQVLKKLYLGKDGYTHGNFAIDSTLTAGDYYIKASTNWLKNFKENHDYVQKIKILGTKNPFGREEKVLAYDVQLLPEGGHLVEGVENSLGVKLIDSCGKGVSFSEGVVLDEKGNNITSFQSNPFGLSRFSLYLKENTSYHARITLADGTFINAPLPKAKKEGIALNVVNTSKETVYVRLEANQKTYDLAKGKVFYLMFHQDGKSSVSEIKFEDDKLELLLRIGRDKLYNGINILTLFNEAGMPLAERMIFNGGDFNSDGKIQIIETEKYGDSISFQFNIAQKGIDDAYNDSFNLSVSVLPKNTVSYESEDNILFSFMLKPYLKGHVEAPSYYFSEVNAKKKYDLDLLLLTQGWSRYDWNDIFSSPPKQRYTIENGISLRASVQKEAYAKHKKRRNSDLDIDENIQFYVHPSTQGDAIIVPVADNNTVEIENLYITDNEALKTSIITPSGKIFKYGGGFDTRPKKSTEELFISEHMSPTTSMVKKEYIDLRGFQSENTIQLDEVEILGEEKKREKDISLFTNDIRKKVDISAEEAATFPTVLDLIRFQGFAVELSVSNNTVSISQQFISTIRTSSANSNGRLIPIVLVDGVRIEDFSILVNLRTDLVESVYANPRDSSYGVRGSGGLIRIKLRTTAIDYNNFSDDTAPPNYSETFLDFPFATVKKFYTPRYNSFNSKAFDSYGTIHWNPAVWTDNRGEIQVNTMLIPGKSYVFYFEGMSKMGNLISQRVEWAP